MDKTDPNTGRKLRPSQSFLMFYELISPTHLVTNYLEEFNKMQGFSKSLPENEKVLSSINYYSNFCSFYVVRSIC